MNIGVLGLDIAKNTFQLHGAKEIGIGSLGRSYVLWRAVDIRDMNWIGKTDSNREYEALSKLIEEPVYSQ